MRFDSHSFVLLATALAAPLLLAAAALPQPLVGGPALWEIGTSARGVQSKRSCLPNPALLAQWEHRRSQCKLTIISSDDDEAVVEYECAGGGFGRSRIKLVTPRTLRIETQGIADSYPFAYTLHARRVGLCQTH